MLALLPTLLVEEEDDEEPVDMPALRCWAGPRGRGPHARSRAIRKGEKKGTSSISHSPWFHVV